jgi:hypothetical protein
MNMTQRAEKREVSMAFFTRGSRRWGMILLGIWLIAANVLPFVSVQISWSGTVLAVLGIVAGVLILLER